jgi:hypothetical protein
MSQDIAPFDIAPTVISQYANSPTIQALLNDFSAWLDPAADLNALYDYVWNIDSAQGFGLDIWGRIVGLDGRVFPISDVSISASMRRRTRKASTRASSGPERLPPPTMRCRIRRFAD